MIEKLVITGERLVVKLCIVVSLSVEMGMALGVVCTPGT